MIGRGIGTRSLANNPKNIGETKGSPTVLTTSWRNMLTAAASIQEQHAERPRKPKGRAAMKVVRSPVPKDLRIAFATPRPDQLVLDATG